MIYFLEFKKKLVYSRRKMDITYIHALLRRTFGVKYKELPEKQFFALPKKKEPAK